MPFKGMDTNYNWLIRMSRVIWPSQTKACSTLGQCGDTFMQHEMVRDSSDPAAACYSHLDSCLQLASWPMVTIYVYGRNYEKQKKASDKIVPWVRIIIQFFWFQCAWCSHHSYEGHSPAALFRIPSISSNICIFSLFLCLFCKNCSLNSKSNCF